MGLVNVVVVFCFFIVVVVFFVFACLFACLFVYGHIFPNR